MGDRPLSERVWWILFEDDTVPDSLADSLRDEIAALEQERNRLRERVNKYLPTVEAYRDAVTEYDPESADRAAQLKRIDVAIGYERTANRKLRAALGGDDE